MLLILTLVIMVSEGGVSVRYILGGDGGDGSGSGGGCGVW